MMYRCTNCGEVFDVDEIEIIRTTYEAYYDAPVCSHTPLELTVCPYCHDEDIEEIEREEQEDD